MPLITLFSSPKPFTNPHIAMIQRNAIKSWTLLPDAEVLLIGEEEGLAEVAKEFGVKQLPNVKRNEKGTPLISSMFQLARENGAGELLCIINADMLLMSDFVEAAKQVKGQRLALSRVEGSEFVLLSQRWDYDITAPIDFSNDWQNRLRSSVLSQNKLHKPAGSDFFLFPKSCYQNIPDFAIGRAGWDNWMIYKARAERYAVIDCTPAMMAVHQNHDYAHLAGAKPHYDHPESQINTQLAGGHAAIRYTILDATRQLRDGKLVRPKTSSARLLRKVELFLRAIFFFLPEDSIENIARPKRWKKRIQKLFK
ncbi:MAG: hypothetical protein PHQ36_09765 [Anaerolineales bacterium]|nr:hypothetical protein [Anaerolineales bacterium]